jgi:hypothetical protein
MPVPGSTDCRLVSIAIHFDRPDRGLPPGLRPGDWEPTNQTTADQFRRFATEAGLTVRSSVQGEQSYLVLSSGASAVFVDERLHSIHYKRANKKPDRRQMTVSLPDETVELLQRRAREENVSVHDLIDRLIKAGA